MFCRFETGLEVFLPHDTVGDHDGVEHLTTIRQESLAALHNLREEAKTIKDETALRLFMEEKANSTYRRQVTKEARLWCNQIQTVGSCWYHCWSQDFGQTCAELCLIYPDLI